MISSEQEIRRLLNKIKLDPLLDPAVKMANLGRLEALVQESSVNAKAFFDYMCENKWKNLAALAKDGGKKGQRLHVINILGKLATYVLADLCEEKKAIDGENNNQKQPLANITNSGELKKATIDQSLKGSLKNLEPICLKVFTKPDGLAIIHNDAIIKAIANGTTKPEESGTILVLISDMCKIAHTYKRRQVYDALAEKLLSIGVYKDILETLSTTTSLPPSEELCTVRVFELAATLPNGVIQLNTQLQLVLDTLRKVITRKLCPVDSDDVVYSAVTVLLDLTASETCLEKVAKYMMQYGMFEAVFAELLSLLKEDAKTRAAMGKSRKYKDLLIGIVLNLACNVETEQIQLHFVEKNVVPILTAVLYDARNDWPSNGSALALLQYCHKCLSNIQVFKKVCEGDSRKDMERYMSTPGSEEAKKNIREALILLSIADRKQKSVLEILTNYTLPAAA